MRDHHGSPPNLRPLVRLLAAAALTASALVPTGLALAPAPASAAPASGWAAADASDFVFSSFHADYTLGRDADRASTLHVVETLVAEFPDVDQNHGIERAIPTSYARVDLGLEILGVRDEAGTPLDYSMYEDDYDGSFLVLRIGSADGYVHGRQVYVIEYTMRDVVRSFRDTAVDEFYWNINGTGTAQPYGEVSATLTLAPELRGTPTGAASCYVGGYGDTTLCPIDLTPDGASVAVTDIGPHQGVTWSIAFPSGTFRAPPLPVDSWIVRIVPWALLGVLLASALIVLSLRLRLFRDSPGRGIVIPQYEGYPELGVMEAAALLRKEERGLPAQFVQLVVTRAARLIDRSEASRAKPRYRLEIVDASELDRDDAIAVAVLFGGTKPGTGIELDTSDRKLGDRIASLRSKVSTEVASQYRTVRHSRWTTVVRLALFLNGVAAIVVAFWAADAEAGSALLVWQIVVTVVGGLIAFGYAGSPAVLTREGALAREHLEGIRDYLQLAEADRIRMLQSPEGAEREPIDTSDREAVVRLHEKLLPYAIIWGVEDRWQQELGTMYATTPTEITGVVGATDLRGFAAGYATASFATTPPPSSSSSWSGSGGSSFSGGSSGGGFSGGGGGGGGAGGW